MVVQDASDEVAIAFTVSKGRQLQLLEELDLGRLLVLSAEDDPARVLKPQGE